MSEGKIHSLPNANLDGAALKTLEENLPDILRAIRIFAKIRAESYRAHLKEGFTPEQAVILCVNPFLKGKE